VDVVIDQADDHCGMDHAHWQLLSSLLLAFAPVLIAFAGVAKLL
jgi:hypothetical protein